MTRSILEIHNLSKIYRDNKKTTVALDNVTLDIKEGETLGLLGVNGAGKTTLSSILATLHPPTNGSVKFKGRSIYKHLLEYRSKLGFCPQKQNLDQFLNVKDNLLFAGRYHLLSEDVIQERVDQLIHELELSKYTSFNIDELSGGTKQRVLIARALVHNPNIIILDEPTVGLDPDIRRKLWNHIKQLKKRGITVILTTHYLDEAEVLSDRICILNRGKVLKIEAVKKLKKEHNMASLEEIFLQVMREAENE